MRQATLLQAKPASCLLQAVHRNTFLHHSMPPDVTGWDLSTYAGQGCELRPGLAAIQASHLLFQHTPHTHCCLQRQPHVLHRSPRQLQVLRRLQPAGIQLATSTTAPRPSGTSLILRLRCKTLTTPGMTSGVPSQLWAGRASMGLQQDLLHVHLWTGQRHVERSHNGPEHWGVRALAAHRSLPSLSAVLLLWNSMMSHGCTQWSRWRNGLDSAACYACCTAETMLAATMREQVLPKRPSLPTLMRCPPFSLCSPCPLPCCRPTAAPKPMPASKPASTHRQAPSPKAVVKGVTIEEEPELSDADLWRQRGNEAFKVDDFVKARRMYTQSIAEEATAAAFSNRALANLKLEEYQKVSGWHGTCREWHLW